MYQAKIFKPNNEQFENMHYLGGFYHPRENDQTMTEL
jgi:hypothetical protein